MADNTPDSTTPAPTQVTLDHNNSCQILTQYIEVAQQKGAYELSEAEVLKRASDFLTKNTEDTELNQINARQLLVQGVTKGQRHGAYTLSDAALLHKVVTFVTKAVDNTVESMRQQQVQPQVPQAEAPKVEAPQAKASVPKVKKQVRAKAQDDLSDLAEPIPLRPRQI